MSLCLIGDIVSAHGIAGAVAVQSQSDHHDRFRLLETVLIGHSPGDATETRILSAREHHLRVILLLSCVHTRNEAEALVGRRLFIPDKQMLPPPPNRHYIHDLIGCRVVSPDGANLGTLEDVQLLPAHDLYVIRHEGREVLIPAVPEFIESVDMAQKRITVQPIPGLFEKVHED